MPVLQLADRVPSLHTSVAADVASLQFPSTNKNTVNDDPNISPINQENEDIQENEVSQYPLARENTLDDSFTKENGDIQENTDIQERSDKSEEENELGSDDRTL